MKCCRAKLRRRLARAKMFPELYSALCHYRELYYLNYTATQGGILDLRHMDVLIAKGAKLGGER